MRVVCLHPAFDNARPRRIVNRRSAAHISDVAPAASVTIGSATESMMRFKRSLSARACTSAMRILR